MIKRICKCHNKTCDLSNNEGLACFRQFINYVCDNCGKDMEYDTITISFGYPHYLDMEVKHFCSDECVADWYLKQNTEGDQHHEDK